LRAKAQGIWRIFIIPKLKLGAIEQIMLFKNPINSPDVKSGDYAM
jgi:hypothetical protein